MAADIPKLTCGLDLAEVSGLVEGRNFIQVEHGALLAKHKLDGGNLIDVARRDRSADRLLRHLTNAGFVLYRAEGGLSSLIRHSRISLHWKEVLEGRYRHQDGLFYELLPPAQMKPTRAVVVFSSVSTTPYETGYGRLFFKNFQSIAKHVPADTLIVRIADVGGVIGAFYTDTLARPDNQACVARLIRTIMAEHGIGEDRIVLYGASKGATGALLHGVLGNLPFVVVDPIVTDAFYLERYRDFHFTEGCFPRRKEELFREILNVPGRTLPSHGCVIYSSRSPQFGYIEDILRPSAAGAGMYFFDSVNPEIKDHPDVAPRTLHTTTMLINMLMHDIPLGGPRVRQIV